MCSSPHHAQQQASPLIRLRQTCATACASASKAPSCHPLLSSWQRGIARRARLCRGLDSRLLERAQQWPHCMPLLVALHTICSIRGASAKVGAQVADRLCDGLHGHTRRLTCRHRRVREALRRKMHLQEAQGYWMLCESQESLWRMCLHILRQSITSMCSLSLVTTAMFLVAWWACLILEYVGK